MKVTSLDECQERATRLQHGACGAGSVDISGGFRLDHRRIKVMAGEKDLKFTPRECFLLAAFFNHPGVTLDRESLLAQAWEPGARPTSRTVDVYVGRIRRKLGSEGAACLLTVGGEGYRWSLEVARVWMTPPVDTPGGGMPDGDTQGLGLPVIVELPEDECGDWNAYHPAQDRRKETWVPDHPSMEWLESHVRVDASRCQKLISDLLPLAESAGKLKDAAWMRLHAGWLAIDRDELEHALELLLNAMRGFDSLQDELGRLRTLNAMGSVHHKQGDETRAVHDFKQAFDLGLKVGAAEYAGSALLNLALSLHAAGRNEEALPMALKVHGDIPLKIYNDATFHHVLGVIYRDLGRVRESEAVLRLAMEESWDRRHERLDSSRALAGILLDTGRMGEAERLILEGLSSAETHSERLLTLRYRVLASRLNLARRDPHRAVQDLLKVFKGARSLRAQRTEAEATRLLFEAWRDLGCSDRALNAHIRFHALKEDLRRKAVGIVSDLRGRF